MTRLRHKTYSVLCGDDKFTSQSGSHLCYAMTVCSKHEAPCVDFLELTARWPTRRHVPGLSSESYCVSQHCQPLPLDATLWVYLLCCVFRVTDAWIGLKQKNEFSLFLKSSLELRGGSKSELVSLLRNLHNIVLMSVNLKVLSLLSSTLHKSRLLADIKPFGLSCSLALPHIN